MLNSIDIIAKKHYLPKDPDYFKTYYQNNNKGILVPCPRCNRCTSKVNLAKHMKRPICLRAFVVRITQEVADRLGLDPRPLDEIDQEEIQFLDTINHSKTIMT